MSLDNSDTFGISSSFVTASNLPDNKGLELELKYMSYLLFDDRSFFLL